MRTLLLLITIITTAASQPSSPRLERRVEYWPHGNVKTSATYVGDVRHGEYRTWREDGTRYELRHNDHGHESGVQQSWDDNGELFLNYEMREGRRYGFVNAVPCLPQDGPTISQREDQ